MMIAVRRAHSKSIRRRAGRKSRARRREGAVMLIVMMILLVATTLAAVSLQATEYELRAAGFARSALQTQYVAEAAMSTTMAWVDATAMDRSLFDHLDDWNTITGQQGPKLELFGEPALGSAGKDTMRGQWTKQAALTTFTMPPITLPDASNDPVGSFGPRVSARPGLEDPLNPGGPADYAVDMYDCRRLDGVGSAGSQTNYGGSGTIKTHQLYCVVTARGRSYVPGGTPRKWKDPNGIDYLVNRFALAHDARGTFVSPPMIAQ